MNIDYNAVIEILKSFLNNEKIEILGISVGEERQVRDAIENLIRAYEKEKVSRKVMQDNWSQNVKLVEELKAELEKEKEDNKRLRKCHLQYEEMTGIDLLLPEKEE